MATILVPGDLSKSEAEEVLTEIRVAVIVGIEVLYESMGSEMAQKFIGEEVIRIFQRHRLAEK